MCEGGKIHKKFSISILQQSRKPDLAEVELGIIAFSRILFGYMLLYYFYLTQCGRVFLKDFIQNSLCHIHLYFIIKMSKYITAPQANDFKIIIILFILFYQCWWFKDSYFWPHILTLQMLIRQRDFSIYTHSLCSLSLMYLAFCTDVGMWYSAASSTKMSIPSWLILKKNGLWNFFFIRSCC